MEKQAKRERKLAEKKAKRLAKEGPKKDINNESSLDPNKPLDLNFLTDPKVMVSSYDLMIKATYLCTLVIFDKRILND